MLIKSSRKMLKKLRHGLPVLPVLLLAFLLASCGQQNTQQTATTNVQDTPAYSFERGFPTAVTSENVYDATDLRRAIEAYKFFFGTMQSEAVMQQMLSNGAVINEGDVPCAVETQRRLGSRLRNHL